MVAQWESQKVIEKRVDLLAIGAEIEDLHLTQLGIKKHLTLQMFQKIGAVLRGMELES